MQRDYQNVNRAIADLNGSVQQTVRATVGRRLRPVCHKKATPLKNNNGSVPGKGTDTASSASMFS